MERRKALTLAGSTVGVVASVAAAVGLNLGLLAAGTEGVPAIDSAAGPGASAPPPTTAARRAEPKVVTVYVDEPVAAPASSSSPATPAPRDADGGDGGGSPPPGGSDGDAPAGSKPPTGAPTSTTSPPTTEAPAPDTEYATFEAGDAGDVVIADHGGETIEFWSADPSSGWQYVVETQTPTKVVVKFRRTAGEGEVTFEVWLSGGKLVTKVEGGGDD